MRLLVRLLTLEPFERHPGRVIASIGVVFATAYLSAVTLVPRTHGRIVDGDTIQYYAYLRSLAIDRDLDFDNDYRLLYGSTGGNHATDSVWLTSTTPTGRRPNLMSIGPAVLWAPFFLATYGTLMLLRPLGLMVPLDGIAAPFPLSAGVAGVVYGALGAYFCYRACRLLVPEGPAFWGAMAAWLATPAVYYSLVSPAYSHATSLFASALFCYMWLKTRDAGSMRRYVWLGLLAGIAALIRWQDIVILVLPGFELLRSVVRGRATLTAAVVRAVVMVFVTAVMLLPQMLAWRAIYGQLIVMPQGEGFMHWTRPALIPVLLSFRHGLFTWTPAALVAVIGLGYLIRRDAFVGWSALAIVLLAVYINASVSDWWAGEAFGARRFVSDTVFFALGLAAVFARDFWKNRPVALRWASAASIVYNLLFLLQYQLFMRGFRELVPYPTTIRQVLFDRLTLPWHLLTVWLG